MYQRTAKTSKTRGLYLKLLEDQRRWVEKCGGDLAGYLNNYRQFGRTDENIAAIYDIDVSELQRLEDKLKGG
jgi:hypothetical protein